MSVPDIPPSQPQTPSATGRPRRLGGFLVAFLVLVGIVLLLPGICSLFFMVAMPGGGGGAVALLWLVCFMIGIAGIVLIHYALRNR